MGSHQNDVCARVNRNATLQKLNAGHAGHHQVRKHNWRPEFIEELKSGRGIGGCKNFKAEFTQGSLDEVEVLGLVIDGQQLWFADGHCQCRHAHPGAPNTTR